MMLGWGSRKYVGIYRKIEGEITNARAGRGELQVLLGWFPRGSGIVDVG